MTPRERFTAALLKLLTVFRVAPNDVLFEAYWEALRDWPIEALEAGARAWIAGEKWMPKPVEWADAAHDWLLERRRLATERRLALAQSTAPPLTREDVHRLVEELTAKLGGGRP